MTRDECTAKADALLAHAESAKRFDGVGIYFRCHRIAHLLLQMAAGNLHVKTAYDEACADFEAFVAAGSAETIDPKEALQLIRSETTE